MEEQEKRETETSPEPTLATYNVQEIIIQGMTGLGILATAPKASSIPDPMLTIKATVLIPEQCAISYRPANDPPVTWLISSLDDKRTISFPPGSTIKILPFQMPNNTFHFGSISTLPPTPPYQFSASFFTQGDPAPDPAVIIELQDDYGDDTK